MDQLSLFKVINASFLEDDATFLPCKMYQSEFLSKSEIHKAGHQEGKSGTIRQWLRLQYTGGISFSEKSQLALMAFQLTEMGLYM